MYVLDFGILPWFCMMVLGALKRADVSCMPDVFSGGCGFAVPEARVVSEPPSLRWPCAQCPSFTSAPPQLCHCSQARLGQPRRWRAKQQEIQDSLVYEYSVMQCCLHWTDWCLLGRHLSVLLVASALAAEAGIREDPNLTSKSFKCL